MNPSEIDNQNRDELFNELKDKCKSIVKFDLYGWLICCIVVIVLLFFTAQRLGDSKDIICFVSWIAVVCFGGCLLLFNFQSLKKIDSLDTPDRLLHWFEKIHRYRMIAWLVSGIFLFVIFLLESGSHFGAIVGIGLAIGIIVLFFYYGNGPWWYRKDKDIIEQLRELVDKK